MDEILNYALLTSVLTATIRVMTPVLFAAMGELITQRAGIWNIGVEGTMLMGAFTAYITVVSTGSTSFAVLSAVLAGGLVGMLTAFLTASLRVDHFITGLGINLLLGGLTLYWFRVYIGGGPQPTFSGLDPVAIPLLSKIPILGEIFFNQRLLTYFAFALVPAVYFLLYHTKWGLELRCLGENPRALDIKGLNVTRRQYLAVVFGSMMTGLGGGFLLLGYSDRYLDQISAGRGWLAIVAIIAGNWRPVGTLAAVAVFALLESLSTHVQVLGFNLPYQIFLALPYVASILLLMGIRNRTHQPNRLGVPYTR